MYNLTFKVHLFIDIDTKSKLNSFLTELITLRKSQRSLSNNRLHLKVGFKEIKTVKKLGLTAIYHDEDRDKFTFYFTYPENSEKENEILEFFRNIKEDCEVIWSKDERLK